MARPRKDSKILNIRLATEVNNKLEKFCNEQCTTKTVAVEKILLHYFNEYFNKNETERKLF